jgi:hypothetical protein
VPGLDGPAGERALGHARPGEGRRDRRQKSLAFQQAYGALHNRIKAFTALPIASLDRMSLQRRSTISRLVPTQGPRMTVYALNGLGRIGKLALKPLLERGAEIAWINDAVGDPAMHAHLLEFDTVHGRWDAAFSPMTPTA